MKAHLLYPDRDFDRERDERPGTEDVVRDLDLDTLLAAMAKGDRFLVGVARSVLLDGVGDPDGIRYRQRVLSDCLAHPDIVRQLYAISVEAIESERHVWGSVMSRFPDSLLHRSVGVMQPFVVYFKRLRRLAEEQGASFGSEGFAGLFRMIAKELDDAYLAEIDDHLRRLRDDAIVMTAELGTGNRGVGYMLRRRVSKRSWKERVGLPDRPGFDYQIPDRDEAGFSALTELKGRGLAIAANALTQSTDHILAFFNLLRFELGFYVGCLNLHEQLRAKGEPTCLPEPTQVGGNDLAARDLYDVCLSLRLEDRVVGNDVAADGKSLVLITGANRGGKSTLLRALGQAQLMLQAGMFAAAVEFRADIRRSVLTHFKREEDVTLRSGKLDEELGRMSLLVERLTPDGLILLNESFASTNEREGSDIASQIVRAMLESRVKVLYVTHLYELGRQLHEERASEVLFLRAERRSDGMRTYRLIEGEPLPTSFGEDVYRRVFGRSLSGAPALVAVAARRQADDDDSAMIDGAAR